MSPHSSVVAHIRPSRLQRRRPNALATAAAILAIDAILAAGIAGAYSIATARADTCDQPRASLCSWTVELSGCDYEDGNPDGRPCLWLDPDTGRAYVNDGSNYR